MKLPATKTPSLSHGSSNTLKRVLNRAFTLIELIVVIVIIGVLAAVAAVSYNAFISGAGESATEAGATQIGKIISAESAVSQADMNTYDDVTDYPQSVLDDINAALSDNLAHVSVNPLGAPTQFALAGTAPTSVVTDGEISVCNSDYSYCVSGALPITPGESIEFGFLAASGSSGGSGTVDTDNDGFTDSAETAAGSDPNDPASTPDDLDGDGFSNTDETTAGSDQSNAASTPDDLDGDGFSNTDEATAGTDPSNAASTPDDLDGDGFSNTDETNAGSDPNNPASTPSTDDDSDGFSNSAEATAGSDPSNPASTPDDLDGDGFSNTDEATAGTDPNDANSYPFYQANGVTYELADAHIFVANANAVQFAMPSGTSPVYVTVDGVARDYATEVEGQVFNGSTIQAIFDWNNVSSLDQNWFSDITQFGLNSTTGQRNQLQTGDKAFRGMVANPSAISNLDTSNLTNMYQMFESATTFNRPLNSWNTSNVSNMEQVFSGAAVFNQPLSNWDTSGVSNMASMFYRADDFDQNISWWNTSNVTTMYMMFRDTDSFNQNLTDWDVSGVTNMTGMFYAASSINQDLSEWCVSQFASAPPAFSTNANAWSLPKPVWGTCPS